MSRNNRGRMVEGKNIGTKEDNEVQDMLQKKKEFIKELMNSEYIVAFIGNKNVRSWGFMGINDLLFFLIKDVYDWDGKNTMFQGIIEGIRKNMKPVSTPGSDTDQLLEEIEKEVNEVVDSSKGEDVVDGDVLSIEQKLEDKRLEKINKVKELELQLETLIGEIKDSRE